MASNGRNNLPTNHKMSSKKQNRCLNLYSNIIQTLIDGILNINYQTRCYLILLTMINFINLGEEETIAQNLKVKVD